VYHLARFGRLLVVGRQPFQIEETYFALQHREASWWGQSAFRKLYRRWRSEPLENPQLLAQPGEWADPLSWLSADWLPATRTAGFGARDYAWLAARSWPDSGLIHWRILGTPQHGLNPQPLPARCWSLVPPQAQAARAVQWAEPTDLFNWVAGQALAGQLQAESPEGLFGIFPIADTTAFQRTRARLDSTYGVLARADYQTYEMAQFAAPDLANPLFPGRRFNPWVMEVDRCWVLADSREVLERILDFYLVGGGMASDTTFLRARQQLPDARGSLSWFRLPAAWSETWLGGSGPMAALGQSRTVGAGLIQTDGVALAALPLRTELSIAWTREAGVALTTKGLWPVVDPLTREAQGLLWQVGPDWQYWSSEGTLRWSRVADGRPLAPPLRVTTEAGESAMLITTDSSWLALAETTGEALDFLPVLTYQPATSPTVIDFFRNGQWVVFLPTRAGRILALDQTGRPWPLWEPVSDTVPLRFPLLHYQLPQRDLIVGFNEQAHWQVWSRTGEERFQLPGPTNTLIGPVGGQQLDDSGAPDRCRLVAADQTGRAQVVSFGGESFPLPLGFAPADEFLLVDCWGDSRTDYLVRRGAEVQLFGYGDDGFRERWTVLFEQPVRQLTALPGRRLGLWMPERQQVHVLEGDGRRAPGFPLAGSRYLWTIPLGDGQTGLVTLVGEDVYVYRLP
ncbi:MAG: hypothetical protein KDC54_02155, partial [Lewinella sp.]|nr:hypothetical protein [Lewinella sp.]